MKDLNLLPKKVLKERKNQEYGKMFRILFIVFLIGNFILILLPFIQGMLLDKEEIKLQEQITKFQVDKNKKDNITQAELENLPKRNMKEIIGKSELRIKNALEEVEINMPATISTISIDADISGKINISGNASSMRGISDLVSNLRKSGKFSKIVLDHTGLDQATGSISFGIAFNFIEKQGE